MPSQSGRLTHSRVVRYIAITPGQFSTGTDGQFSTGSNTEMSKGRLYVELIHALARKSIRCRVVIRDVPSEDSGDAGSGLGGIK